MTSFLVAWVFNSYLRPTIIEAGCGEIAQKSSDLYNTKNPDATSAYNYNNLKARCLEEASTK